MQIKTTGSAGRRVTPSRNPRRAASPRILGALLVFLAAGSASAEGDGDSRITASREYAARLQKELGARLKAAIAAGGPASAIAVCQVDAPRIAQELSGPGGPVHVGRTALRVRNPANEPDQEARAVLEQFASGVAQGRTGSLTHFAVRPDGSARYMQAILMQPLCLTCHGSALAPDVEAAIAVRYPDDQATGFTENDLRGAFVIEWPARVSYQD